MCAGRSVVSAERQADVDPSPLDAAVIERKGVLEDAASEQREEPMELAGARVTGRHASPSFSVLQAERSTTIEKPSFLVITT